MVEVRKKSSRPTANRGIDTSVTHFNWQSQASKYKNRLWTGTYFCAVLCGIALMGFAYHGPKRQRLTLNSGGDNNNSDRSRYGYSTIQMLRVGETIPYLPDYVGMTIGGGKPESDGSDMIASGAASLVTQFPSLAGPLGESEIVGLYFGAGWCGMTTPITPLLNEVYGSVLSQMDSKAERKPLSIVYVSSDSSEGAMKNYIQKAGSLDWIRFLPYDHEDRNNLKRHFSVCSMGEISTILGEKGRRKHEIPALILLEGISGRVLSQDGVDYLRDRRVKNAEDVRIHWKELI
mmetsp:Transcript_34825/g.80505  ORF Transcript_34825/g.80505 Transcript_34825/m.80505 type:complete len:290 (-) Transcript_34825:39-908(-)